MLYEIRADRDVTSKGPEGSGTRRRTVKLPEGEVILTLGALPVYLNTDVLPPEIAGDEHLVTKAVSAESLHPGVTVIELKAERVQEESVADPGTPGDTGAHDIQRKRRIPPPPPDDAHPDTVNRLKSSWVQEPTAALATDEPGIIADLKSERVQEESVADPGEEADLKAERVQEEMAAAPPDDDDKLKAERVQNPTAVAAINKPKRR
jgi:hypothetical protein